MSNTAKAKYFRKGRVIYRAYPARNVPVRTCANEWKAALALRSFTRLDGGNLGSIPIY